MSLSLVHSRALLGLEARPVCVEVHLANGLPSFTLVGLADTGVKEARERVRSAIANAGLEFPSNKRIQCSQALFLKSVSGRSRSSAVRAFRDLCRWATQRVVHRPAGRAEPGPLLVYPEAAGRRTRVKCSRKGYLQRNPSHQEAESGQAARPLHPVCPS